MMLKKIQETIQSFQNIIAQLFDYYRNAYENSNIGSQTQQASLLVCQNTCLKEEEKVA